MRSNGVLSPGSYDFPRLLGKGFPRGTSTKHHHPGRVQLEQSRQLAFSRAAVEDFDGDIAPHLAVASES